MNLLPPADVNLVAGLVLPVPEDARWKMGSQRGGSQRPRTRLARLGSICVYGFGAQETLCIRVDGTLLPQSDETRQYAQAVVSEMLGRAATKAICGPGQ